MRGKACSGASALTEYRAMRDRRAAQEVIRAHRTLGGALHFDGAAPAFSAANREFVIESKARSAAAVGERRAQRLYTFRLAIEIKLEPSARIWREHKDEIVHLACGPRPVDTSLCRIDLLGISDAALCLRTAIEPSPLKCRERVHH